MQHGLKRDGHTVYVPVADSELRGTIRAGSGIVGTVQEDGRVLIDYEGNLYDNAAMRSYSERVLHAFDRHTWGGRGYPTVARALVDFEQLLEVGFIIVPDKPTDLDVIAEARRRGYQGPMIPALDHIIRRELAAPRVVIDRQDIVDEWCAAVTV